MAEEDLVQELVVTPSQEQQVFDSPGGYGPVTVEAVTSAIDNNIKSENIKTGVSILGVLGSFPDVRDGFEREITSEGVLRMPTRDFSFSLPSDVNDLNYAAMHSAFYYCSNLTSVDLSSLTTVSGYSSMYFTFSSCTSLTSVDLSNLTTLSGADSMTGIFSSCTSLTSIDLSNLTTVRGSSAMSSIFYECTSLTTLSFPALTSTSFGSQYTNQFNDMLKGVTGCTVHFPSNLQSVIGSWASVVAGFSGTNTTVLFDLPSTEVVSNTYTLTVQINDDYCNYLSLNGTEVSHGRGNYTYTYPSGTTVAVRYDTTSQSNVTASYVMDQDRTLSIGSSTWVIN